MTKWDLRIRFKSASFDKLISFAIYDSVCDITIKRNEYKMERVTKEVKVAEMGQMLGSYLPKNVSENFDCIFIIP